MNALLSRLGVPGEVQKFFNVTELLFCFGEHFEHFGDGFHRVPTTSNIWLAGSDQTREVIITSTVMEAIAFLTINLHRYPSTEILAFLALGNLPHHNQIDWIGNTYPKRKYTLVFGTDLLGRLADVKVATRLQKKPASLIVSDSSVQVICDNKLYEFEQDCFSLHLFEKMSGMRSGIRTCKPKDFDTFLNQLKYDARQ